MVRLSIYIMFIVAFSSISCTKNSNKNFKERPPIAEEEVIYGDDDRKDIYQVTNPTHLELARSTVALVSKTSFQETSPVSDYYDMAQTPFGTFYGLCTDEPFKEQNAFAFCSGTLIAPNQILTAGHCITDRDSCRDTQFVFDWAIQNQNDEPKQTPKSNVYDCVNIIKHELRSNGADYAIVEIDRPVTDRNPAQLDQFSNTTAGTPLVVIGHPSGLPTKVADGAVIRRVTNRGYFVANLDTYGGNSGSGVFNENTGKLIGVLVRGETDFVYDNRKNCFKSNVCSANACRGEDVTSLDAIMGTP